jgi:hypothetical protein
MREKKLSPLFGAEMRELGRLQCRGNSKTKSATACSTPSHRRKAPGTEVRSSGTDFVTAPWACRASPMPRQCGPKNYRIKMRPSSRPIAPVIQKSPSRMSRPRKPSGTMVRRLCPGGREIRTRSPVTTAGYGARRNVPRPCAGGGPPGGRPVPTSLRIGADFIWSRVSPATP